VGIESGRQDAIELFLNGSAGCEKADKPIVLKDDWLSSLIALGEACRD
jgi:hypothetical protein